MKLSIFPRANWLPQSKEEKAEQGRLCSAPNEPEVVSVTNEEELINYVTSYAWSPSVFSGTRKDENFTSADFMALDVDSGLSIAEAEARVQKLGLSCLCLPSPSYSPETPKFRLIFPLAKTIFSSEDFDATWDWLQKQFPELDENCSDEARWYCMAKMDDGFFQDGKFLVPVKGRVELDDERLHSHEEQITVTEDIAELVAQIYGRPRDRVPASVEFFLKNAATGLPGLWISSLNSFAFSLALSGVDDNIIWEVAEKISPQPLDSRDTYQIKRSIRDGKRKRESL